MTVKTWGIVLAQTSLSSQDKRLTILTSDYGLIDAIARNVSGARSKLAATSEVLAYSDFCLFKGKSGYIINTADLENNFYGLRADLPKLSLAGYFCELTHFVLPTEDNGNDCLRLLLNTLHLLEKGSYSPAFLKPVFELRLLSLSGFAPNLENCCICGKEEGDDFCFLPVDGRIICKDCLQTSPYDKAVLPLPISVRKAMNHLIQSDMQHLFSFRLNRESLTLLESIAEYFALCHADGTFHSLNFYKSL